MPAIPQPDDFAVQRDYMHDSGAFGASQAKVDEFARLEPIQRGQVVHQLALQELRESASHAGLPLRNLDRASWRDLVTLADTLRQPAPTSPEAAMREAGIPLVAPPDTRQNRQNRQNRQETLVLLREAGIPTTQHAPAQADESADRPLIEHFQEAGVPLKDAGLSDQEAALSRRLDQLERMVETGRPRPTSSLPDPLAAAFGHQEEQPEMSLAEAMAEAGLLKAAS
jgi:hypothetical protein